MLKHEVFCSLKLRSWAWTSAPHPDQTGPVLLAAAEPRLVHCVRRRWMMIPPESTCTAPESRGGILTYGILMCWMHITAADAMPHTWCTNTWSAAVHEVCRCVGSDSAESCLHTTRFRWDSTWPTTLVIIALTAHCGLFSSEEISRLQLLHRWHPINVTLQSAARGLTSCTYDHGCEFWQYNVNKCIAVIIRVR